MNTEILDFIEKSDIKPELKLFLKNAITFESKSVNYQYKSRYQTFIKEALNGD